MIESTPRSSADTTGIRRPKARPVSPVDRRRVAIASVALCVVVGMIVVAARTLDRGPGSAMLAVLLGLVIVPIVASPLEWLVHRFVYHAPAIKALEAIFRVHTAHHYAYFPTWRYVTAGPARRLSIRMSTPFEHTSWMRNASVRLAHFGWYMAIGVVIIWLPAWVVTHNGAFLVGIVAASVVVSNLFIVVHDTIHRPGSHRIVEAQPWYPFLDRHHYVHHIDLGANLNFLLPLADLLFGTLRRTLTSEELSSHGTLASAKSRPVGCGERAKTAVL
jgi:hypothetical protein